ncbi:hypothetical protein NMT12_190029 [metagenome]
MGEVMLRGYECERCKHQWVPRDESIPTVCPKCKSPYWNKPRNTNIPKKKLMKKEKIQ